MLRDVLFSPGAKTIDLSVFADGARHVLDGQPLFGPAFGQDLAHPLPFIYPPFAAVALTPVTLLSAPVLRLCWELASIAALWAVVAISFGGLKARVGRYWPLLVAAITVAMIFTQPVLDELGYGQIDLFLLLAVMVDLCRRPRWLPPGVLIGIAAGIKLVPLVFILVFLVILNWRAIRNVLVSFVGATLIGFAVVPGDSATFWFHEVEGTALHWRIANYSNQSFDGMLHRLIGGAWPLAWIPLALVAVVVGLVGARAAERAGERLVAVALVALAGLLISPISWIHELVFIVPILGAIVGAAFERGRVLVGVAVWIVFSVSLGLPYKGLTMITYHGSGLAGAALEDAYGVVLFVLLLAGARCAVARWANPAWVGSGRFGSRGVVPRGVGRAEVPLEPARSPADQTV